MKNKKKMIMVAVLVILVVMMVTPTVLAYGTYSGSCMRYFYTSDQVYHDTPCSYKHRNDHNYFGNHDSGADTYSINWYNSTDGGSDSAQVVTNSGDTKWMYTSVGKYNLAVKNKDGYNVERMYSHGIFY